MGAEVVTLYERQLYQTKRDRVPDSSFHDANARNIVEDITNYDVYALLQKDGRLELAYRKISEAYERAGDMSKSASDKRKYYESSLVWIQTFRPGSGNLDRINKKLERLTPVKRL